MFTLSYMYGVHARSTCTPYMYDSVNTALTLLVKERPLLLDSIRHWWDVNLFGVHLQWRILRGTGGP